MAQRVWFITGISSGLGRSMAEKLLGHGDHVAGTARKLEQLDDLQARYPDRLSILPLDLTDTADIRRVVESAFTRFSRIDVVVSNAGYGLFGAAEELTDEQILHQLQTNLIGSIQLIRAVLPHLRAQGGGRILQLSSTGGQFAFPGFSLYHATKWGIEGFVESVAQEVAPFGIECTIVEPGATKTGFRAGIVGPEPTDAYDQTPVGDVRRLFASNTFPIPGDADKVAQAIIDSVDHNPAPGRLSLGSDTYTLLRRAWHGRLAALEQQKQIALSTDREPINL